MEIPKGLTLREKDIWKEGYLVALYEWAWYKDGTMYVGTCGKTYKEIEEELLSK